MYHFSQRKRPLYIRIKGELVAKISGGRGLLAENPPTEEDLTRSYGVSRETVRRALARWNRKDTSIGWRAGALSWLGSPRICTSG